MPTELTEENEAYLNHLHEERWQVVRYLNGKGIEISENDFAVWQRACKLIHEENPAKYRDMFRFISKDFITLPEIDPDSLDYIFVSEPSPGKLINDTSHWLSKLKPSGHLILHKTNKFEVQNKQGQIVLLPPRQPKHVCIIRLGAIGDMLQTSSLLPELKRQGWHITFIGSTAGLEVIRHDPHIDELVPQDVDVLRNTALRDELGPYWEWLATQYDRVINLCSSVEATWLPNFKNPAFHWPASVRHKHLNYNYVQFMHELAQVPYTLSIKFYPTDEEKEWAKKELAAMRERSGCSRTIVWALAGSSAHKLYPHMDPIIAKFLIDHRDVEVVLVGGDETYQLQGGWQKEKRVHLRAAEWSIRQTLTFVQFADLVIGPETGVLNSVATEKMPKVVFLSHSTKENLTRDWRNTASVHADYEQLKKDCNQCCMHRLHQGTPNDPKGWHYIKRGPQFGAALCQEMIDPEQVYRIASNAIRTGKVSGK